MEFVVELLVLFALACTSCASCASPFQKHEGSKPEVSNLVGTGGHISVTGGKDMEASSATSSVLQGAGRFMLSSMSSRRHLLASNEEDHQNGRFVLASMGSRRRMLASTEENQQGAANGFCGVGLPPHYKCASLLPVAKNATCCNGFCADAFSDFLHCGGCFNRCKYGTQRCCCGKCVKFLTDRHNCGWCGHRCLHKERCEYGICGYGRGSSSNNSTSSATTAPASLPSE